MSEDSATQARKHEEYLKSLPPGDGYSKNSSGEWKPRAPDGYYRDENGAWKAIPSDLSRAIERGRQQAAHEKAARDRCERPSAQELRDRRFRAQGKSRGR